jgi:hypothetical protein
MIFAISTKEIRYLKLVFWSFWKIDVFFLTKNNAYLHFFINYVNAHHNWSFHFIFILLLLFYLSSMNSHTNGSFLVGSYGMPGFIGNPDESWIIKCVFYFYKGFSSTHYVEIAASTKHVPKWISCLSGLECKVLWRISQ